MTNKTIQMEESLYTYFIKATLREPEVFERLRSETAQLEVSHM